MNKDVHASRRPSPGATNPSGSRPAPASSRGGATRIRRLAIAALIVSAAALSSGLTCGTPNPMTPMPRTPSLLNPIASGEFEITDAGNGHVTGNAPNPEVTMMTRVGNRLYFVYRINNVGADVIYVRAFDLTTNTFGPSVLVDNQCDEATDGYHTNPAIFRDQAGRLHVLNSYVPQNDACYGTNGIAPRHRIIGDLNNSATWSPIECLSTRTTNLWGAPGARAFLEDLSGVYDDRAGVTHLVGHSASITVLDGQPVGGLPRSYYRILANGNPDGPYVLVETTGSQPPQFPPGGNIFAKGDIVLGREPTGQRSLHVVWNIRNTFSDGNGSHQWNYDLLYARSTDGGQTWSPINSALSVPVTTHITWNDPQFRVFTGDCDQNTERAFDVDNESRPVMLVVKHRPGTGTFYGPHVDVLNGNPPAYDLHWQWWNGSQWVGGLLDNTRNWANTRPKLRVDLDDRWYLLLGEPPQYRISRDFGATWDAPVFLGQNAGDGWRIHSYADPIDPNFHYIAYQKRNSKRLYFVKLQLTQR